MARPMAAVRIGEMGRSELQENSRQHVIRMLRDLASKERQVFYKSAVPFVHAPIELLEQWANYSRLLAENRDWFMEIFSAEQLEALRAFDGAVSARNRDNNMPDVDEIFSSAEWNALGERAEALLAVLVPPEEMQTGGST